jgi:hypothetical protein
MRRVQSDWLWVGVVIVIALGFRVVLLYWSSLPSTLDGFAYAAAGEMAVQTGSFPLDGRLSRRRSGRHRPWHQEHRHSRVPR